MLPPPMVIVADFPGRNNGVPPVGAASAANSASIPCYVKPGRLWCRSTIGYWLSRWDRKALELLFIGLIADTSG